MKNNELAIKLLVMVKDELSSQNTLYLNAWHNDDIGVDARREKYRSWANEKEFKVEEILKEFNIRGIVNISSNFSLLSGGQMYYLNEQSFQRLVARS